MGGWLNEVIDSSLILSFGSSEIQKIALLDDQGRGSQSTWISDWIRIVYDQTSFHSFSEATNFTVGKQ